jgi:thioredoxin 1
VDELDEIRKRKMQELMKKIREEGQKTGVGAPITVTDGNFEQVVSQNPVVVIDCWAPWCGPCRMIAPTIEALASQLSGKVVFGKLNVDENPAIAMRFGIMSIPTLLFIKNGIEVGRIVGAVPRGRVEAELRKYL